MKGCWPVVLLILAVLWAFVLIPPMVRSRSEVRRERSMRRLRRRLPVLAPRSPAQRPLDASLPAGAARHHVALIARPPAGAGADGEADDAEESAGTADAPPVEVEAEAVPAPPTDPHARREALQRRRRRRLGGLAIAMASTLVLGALPPVRILWALHAVLDVVAVAYAAWLRRIHRQRMAAAAKVVYLNTAEIEIAEDVAALAVPLRRRSTGS